MDNEIEREQWLRKCYEIWTNSTVQTEAWKYRGDFEGFKRWFTEIGGTARLMRRVKEEGL